MEDNAGPVEDGDGVTADKVRQQMERAVADVRGASCTVELLRRMHECGLGGVGGGGGVGSTYAIGEEGEKATTRKDAEAIGEESILSSSSSSSTSARRLRFCKMVILGLGSPSNSNVSRVQLALALILSEHLSLPLNAVELYDPVFTPIDLEILSERGMKVISREESNVYTGVGEGKMPDAHAGTRGGEGGDADVRCTDAAVPEDQSTFFYMPHCEGVLYDGLLRTNWSTRGALRGHAVLGNNFETYVERWSHVSPASLVVGSRSHQGTHENDGNAQLQLRPAYVLAAAAVVKYRIAVDPSGTFGGAFNDTSVQVLDSMDEDNSDGGGGIPLLPKVPP